MANEVGVFEELAEGSTTLGELAQSITVSVRTLRILADTMVALGFVQRQKKISTKTARLRPPVPGRGAALSTCVRSYVSGIVLANSGGQDLNRRSGRIRVSLGSLQKNTNNLLRGSRGSDGRDSES
jgi:hypothetical protein